MLPIIVKADDDEECLLCDAMVGIAVAVCEEIPSCRTFMGFTAMIVIFVSFLMCIFGGAETRRDMWENTPSYKRLGSTVGGYTIAKAFLNNRNRH